MAKKTNFLTIAAIGIGGYLLLKYLAQNATAPRLAGLSGDVESDEDLARAAANLAAMEQHLESSAAATGDPKWLDALSRCRNMRRAAMLKLMPGDTEGESFCCLKHGLLASVQLCETAAKKLAEGDKEQAMQLLKEGKQARDAMIAFAKSARPGAQCSVCKNA
jgi:hypothetical protein